MSKEKKTGYEQFDKTMDDLFGKKTEGLRGKPKDGKDKPKTKADDK